MTFPARLFDVEGAGGAFKFSDITLESKTRRFTRSAIQGGKSPMGPGTPTGYTFTLGQNYGSIHVPGGIEGRGVRKYIFSSGNVPSQARSVLLVHVVRHRPCRSERRHDRRAQGCRLRRVVLQGLAGRRGGASSGR
jgi:hypothetical protein